MTSAGKTPKWTKGPWRFAQSKGGAWFVYSATDEQPFRPRVRVPRRGTKLERANALLISKAPEMADLLKKLVATLTGTICIVCGKTKGEGHSPYCYMIEAERLLAELESDK